MRFLGMALCEFCFSDVAAIPLRQESSVRNFGKCSACGLLQSLEIGRPSRIEGLNFDGYLMAQDLTFEKSRRSVVLLEIERILTLNGLKLSVFDIGTGAGHFLNDAKSMGFEVAGNELSHTAALLVNQKYGFEILAKNYEELGFIDFQSSVTMFCVLAHSINPELLLKSIHKSLKSGGVLYFHTPRYCVIDSLAIFLCRISSGVSNRLLLRRIGGDHKRIYTRKSLIKLLQNSGFSEFNMTPEIGYGLKKENYFMAMGLP